MKKKTANSLLGTHLLRVYFSRYILNVVNEPE